MPTPDVIRKEFAKILKTQNYDWGLRQRYLQDDVGPLFVRYGLQTITVGIENVLLDAFDLKDGQTLFDQFNKVRNELAQASWVLWRTRLCRYVFSRRLTWRELLSHVGSHNKGPLLFALVMLRAGHADYGPVRVVFTYAPKPSQQKDSVILPDLNRPGITSRVYAFQAER